MPPQPHELVPRPGFEFGDDGYTPELRWSDEFDGCENGTDPSMWTHEEGLNRNSELQEYHKESARCVDGVLEITATFEPERLGKYCKNPGGGLSEACHGSNSGNWPSEEYWNDLMGDAVKSASIVSKAAFFLYGQYDARIRINIQDASWPAWWFTGPDPSAYGGWPTNGGKPLLLPACATACF